jgi:hypothetical protein
LGTHEGKTARAKGWHMLEIDEIVRTQTCGYVVIYREWLIDPDGKEVRSAWEWVPNRNHVLLRTETGFAISLSQRQFKRLSVSEMGDEYRRHEAAQPGEWK